MSDVSILWGMCECVVSGDSLSDGCERDSVCAGGMSEDRPRQAYWSENVYIKSLTWTPSSSVSLVFSDSSLVLPTEIGPEGQMLTVK